MMVALKDVYEGYRKYLYVEDTDRLDVALAVAKAKELPGIPLWVIFIGPSGDWKSGALTPFLKVPHAERIPNLTSKTFVNGFKDKKKYPDYAPTLDGKLGIILDMAQILQLPPVEKAEVWAQLRDLYDGFAGKLSGMGSRAKYSDIKFSLLAASTPKIDSQILIHQDLGTRELLYRTPGSKDKRALMEKCDENEPLEKEMKAELSNLVSTFVQEREVVRFELDEDTKKQLQALANFTSLMRAPAEFDSGSNELRNVVYPEEPTRIYKQLKRLYILLMNLDDDYPNEKAFRILWHVARSSAFPMRIKLFNFFINESNLGKEFRISNLSGVFKIGKSTVKRECLAMENMGLLKCKRNEDNYNRTNYFFSLNSENEVVKKLSGELIGRIIKPNPKDQEVIENT